MAYSGPTFVPTRQLVEHEQRSFDRQAAEAPDPVEPLRVKIEQDRFDEMSQSAPDPVEEWRTQYETRRFDQMAAEAPDLVDPERQAAPSSSGAGRAVPPVGETSGAPSDIGGSNVGAEGGSNISPEGGAKVTQAPPSEPVAKTLAFLDTLKGSQPTEVGKTPAFDTAAELAKFDAMAAGFDQEKATGTPQDQRQGFDFPTPEPPSPGQNLGLRTPFGPALAPASLPINLQKPTPPDEEQQRRVLAGEAPFVDAQQAVGGMVRHLTKQGEALPAAADGAIPGVQLGTSEDDLARAFRHAQIEAGGIGGAGRGMLRAAGEVGGGGGDVLTSADAAIGAEVKRLRLDKFPEEVRDDIAAAAQDGDFWRTQRRGVLPDDQAEEMADRLGRSVDQIIAGGKAGKAYSTEETRALRNAMVSQAMKVNELGDQIAKAPTEATDALIAEQIAQGMKLSDLSRIAEGARAEAGRTLRAYTALARDYAADPVNATQRIFKIVGDRDQALKAVNEYQKLVQNGGDAFQMAKYWARVEKPPPGIGDWFRLLRYNAMLSGPRTFMVNLVGNGAEVLYRVSRDAAASTVRGRPEEILPEVKGAYAGFRRGLDSAMDVMMHGISEEAAKRGDVPSSLSARLENPIARNIATTLEVPTRTLQAADEPFHQLAYGLSIGREAAKAASAQGLRGHAWAERVAELMGQPTTGMMKLAEGTANRMTFKGDMGATGNLIGGLSRLPVIGPVVLPFVKTVYHISARGIDRSPLGLVGTAIDLKAGKYGGTVRELRQSLGAAGVEGQVVPPLGERVFDNALGATVAVWLYTQAMEGNVTGAGPDDPEKRDMLRATGWQPYSFKIGDRYVSYANWGPFALTPALAAGAAEAQTYAKPGASVDKTVLDALRRTSQVVQEQTYLKTIGDVWRAFKEPDKYGGRLEESLVENLVPFGSLLNTVGQATDPLLREPQRGNVAENVAERLPGLRQQLPPRDDVLGRPIENPQQGLGALSPLRVSDAKPEPLIEELLRRHVDISPAPKDVLNVPLNPAEQRKFEEVNGRLIQQYMPKVLAEPNYQRATPEQQSAVLSALLDRLRGQARSVVLGGMGEAEARRRLTERKDATRYVLPGAVGAATAGASRG